MTGTRVLVTGGGTGGHVYPGIAIAQELVRRGIRSDDVRFVGSRRGIEARVVPEAGFAIDLLPGRGLQRSVRPGALAQNAEAIWGALAAFVRSVRIVARVAPSVVLGVGGYASLPCLLAARLRGVPLVVHEQNAAPGLANRIAVRVGARAATSLPATPLAGATLTGNPVRAEIAAVRRAPDPLRPLVAVFGGSLGARRVNAAALGLYDRWRARPDVAVRHVAGPRDYEACVTRLSCLHRPDDRLAYDLVRYEDHMDELYARAAIAVCRSGAVTVAELAAAGVPALLVPLPGAPGDHQARNARVLADAGAARIVPDAELEPDRLGAELDALLGEPEWLASMGAAARSLARPDAAARVADLVLEAAGVAA